MGLRPFGLGKVKACQGFVGGSMDGAPDQAWAGSSMWSQPSEGWPARRSIASAQGHILPVLPILSCDRTLRRVDQKLISYLEKVG